MEFTSIVSYATQLKKLLTSHDQAVTQLNLLDCKIQDLDNYLFTSELSGNHGNILRLQTKKSTIVGIRKMYNQYREKKWNQIQELTTLILKSANSTPASDTNNTVESSPRGRQLDNDTTVQPLIEEFCVFYRNC